MAVIMQPSIKTIKTQCHMTLHSETTFPQIPMKQKLQSNLSSPVEAYMLTGSLGLMLTGSLGLTTLLPHQT